MSGDVAPGWLNSLGKVDSALFAVEAGTTFQQMNENSFVVDPEAKADYSVWEGAEGLRQHSGDDCSYVVRYPRRAVVA